jgi:hypothetical protein
MTEGKNLRIPRTLAIGVGEEQKKQVQEKWNTADEVEVGIREAGFPDHNTPSFACPELDVHLLTSPDSKQYTETYAQLLSWFTYASEKLAQIQVRLLQYENMQDVMAAQTRQAAREQSDQSGNKKPTAEEMKDRLLRNPEYLEITRTLQRYQQGKIVMSAKVESLERTLRLISRQIEIRRLDIEQGRTGAAMPARNQRDPFSRQPTGPG